MKTRTPASRGQRGFTLVEVMVSTVVALFATLAIFQSFAVSEGYRRSATSGGDASFAGALGTFMLDSDLRMAGYGINTATYLGCAVTGSDSGVTPTAAINFTLAPVQITPGTGTNPDSITIVSSNTGMMPGAINFTTALASPTNNYVVTDAYGVKQGDVLLLAEAGQACTLVEATNTPTNGSSNQNTIKHAVARYNPAGGLGPNYSANAVVMDMGPLPTANTYRIQNNAALPNFNSLVVDQLIADRPAQPVAANVVQLRALYGKSSTGNGIVDTWNTTAPANSTDWSNVLAIRIAMVARNAKPEKPDPTSGNCATTTAAPSVTWDDNTTTTLDVSATTPTGPSWKCYRYRVFHVTSSLRNLIWTPS
ncbi:MAG TPA: PilW family protein [Burkholderiaceae bacterium]|jgi:type IV pilus assembly protein PilW|nr:PilW family protein [Burkholderiaceae bacterium]